LHIGRGTGRDDHGRSTRVSEGGRTAIFGNERGIADEREPSVADALRHGWTEQLLQAFLARPDQTREESVRGVTHVDFDVSLSAFGQAVAKFDMQRVLYGWISAGAISIPTIIGVAIAEVDVDYRSPTGTVIGDPEDIDDRIAEDEEQFNRWGIGEDERRLRRRPRTRSQVGQLTLDTRLQRSAKPETVLPYFRIALRLREREWAPLHSCLTLAATSRARPPMFAVRVQFPAAISPAEVVKSPTNHSFPVVRFWSDAVIAWADALDSHPLFAQDMRSGGIEQFWLYRI